MVTECSLNLEFMNYTVITSQCKGPKFPVKECCSSFLEFACPYAEQLNDLSTDCASTMFSYINIYGKYPAGLFSSQCKGDKEGLECPDMPPNSVADVNTATTTTTASSRIWMTVALFVTVLLFRGRQSHMRCMLNIAPSKHLDRPGVSFCSRTTYTENAITNAVDIYRNSSGALHFMASNNDCGVRDFDMERYQLVQLFRYLWPVNHSSLSPDGKLVAVVGDDPNGLLVDSSNGQTIGTLKGHLDYSFASAWHPNGVTFATGNQDKTCRIWDTRKTSESVAVLRGNLGAIRSIRFTSDGRYIAMAEPADFVHVYDTKTGYKKEQEIDFFGEISGISFSPDTESLFIGVWDRTYGSLLEYGRTRDYSYLDSLL
ncbi:hypothetical protein F2Q69_00019501 [Brassica cretica]|uniref:GPI-anchored protein LLG1-like domain-containing protein n=1 Tax=Brassica cretica TaxID=69181 RepID=A0A8S9QMG7_BRACR|nr:hypothetical protein F2Q69_00019501 [Brassica cretica]